MKSFKYYLLGFSFISIMLASCGDDEMTKDPGTMSEEQTYDNGVLIVNEGPFMGGSGTLDFYDRDKDTLLRNVYSSVNEGQFIGSILQSVTVIGDNAYLVVNNSAKIEVVDAETMEYKNTISGVNNPRYIVALNNNEAVVSEWGVNNENGQLKKINLLTMEIIDSVAVNGPEQMVVSDSKIYVANSGGIGESDKVTVHGFDLTQQSEIMVGKRTIDMVEDVNGAVWVLSGGSFVTSDGASICRIVDGVSNFCKGLSGFPSDLIVNASGDNLYYVEDGQVKRLEVNNEAEDFVVNANITGFIYGLGYDGEENELYIGTTPDYSSESTTFVRSTNGDLRELTTGILTNGFVAR